MREPVAYSIIIPVYNDEKALYDTYKRLKYIIAPASDNYELIFVDDNSSDRSPDILRVFCAADIRIRAIYLSDCFGYTAAVEAGIDHASKGSAIMVMDVKASPRNQASTGSTTYAIRAKEGFTHSPLWDYEPESSVS